MNFTEVSHENSISRSSRVHSLLQIFVSNWKLAHTRKPARLTHQFIVFHDVFFGQPLEISKLEQKKESSQQHNSNNTAFQQVQQIKAKANSVKWISPSDKHNIIFAWLERFLNLHQIRPEAMYNRTKGQTISPRSCHIDHLHFAVALCLLPTPQQQSPCPGKRHVCTLLLGIEIKPVGFSELPADVSFKA